MNSLTISAISAACIFLGAMLGMFLRMRLPTHHLREEDSKDTIKVGAGMIASLAALVLGLLVSSAKSSYDTMNAEVTQAAAKIVLLDRVLANYGTETKKARQYLRNGVLTTVNKIWPKESSKSEGLSALEHINYMEHVQKEMLALSPSSDSQHVLMTQAQLIVIDLRQTRWLLVEQSHNSLPGIFLVILIFWLMMLHLSFGLFAPKNLTVISVLLISSISLSGAIFLILELSHPMHGLIKVSGDAMYNALEHLAQE